MIFVSGIHGVGKPFFCDMVKAQLGIEYYSASELITPRRGKAFSNDKLVPDIDDNQPLLVEAVEELRSAGTDFILDGHFCLLDAKGMITRIPAETYRQLKPNRMVLLTEKPEVIAKRRRERDGVDVQPTDIDMFQAEEARYAREISKQLNTPLEISSGAEDEQRVIDWIKAGGR